ncbi:hypothetical protein SAMN05421810_10287 [Amycolatopsis arida]|uniref:Uncharacterized protein n=1 Tax=Amycolatopsis arida TaxID=587909 RepID=A0A1I5NZQ5_9PSEU|nr:hypothetical protein [Amycolatopsis arida]TDX98295.1 hypothetical protein CLV69_10187 [Amycolatopsis arida]SFP27080.1 hypothetical protein SAMN05421810_10287 [Amycolatopsis arida]
MTWQQPCPPHGLRTLELPCPNGCGGHWTHPAAERDRVVDPPDDRPTRVAGNADAANRLGADFIAGALRYWGIDHPAWRDRS